jgi:hypothetical protein
VWTNDKGEVIFCSRPEPIQEVFGSIIASGKFKEDAGLKLSFPAMLE